MTEVLAVRDLTVGLPAGADRPYALRNVSFTVNPGEIVCLVGESGSGKSVSAQTIMGLLPKSLPVLQGAVRLEGEDVLKSSEARLRELRGSRMSMIFQEPLTALNPVMTCGGQIDEVLATHTALDAARRRARGLSMLERVRIADPPRVYCAYPHQLSGGQRQRIMIAMALVMAPPLLIADEPTTALDVTTQAQILALIKELGRERNMAVLFITHDFGVVSEIADRVAVLRLGELVEFGAMRQVLKNPGHDYTRRLLAAVPSLTPRTKSRMPAGPILLRTEDLGKIYAARAFWRKRRGLSAASAVNLCIRRGEVLGLVGESGSGKSTVARLVARLIEPSSGKIWLGAEELSGLPERRLRQFRRRIQIVFQDPYRSLNPRRKVGDSIIEGPMNFGLKRKAALSRAAGLLEFVGLEPAMLERFPQQFSGGQRQRIAIARALAMEPELLIADEPVSALDVSVQAQVLALFARIGERLGLSMLFITHDLRVAAQICDTIAVMQHGHVVEHGEVAQVFARPEHPYTRALLDSAPGRDFAFGDFETALPSVAG